MNPLLKKGCSGYQTDEISGLYYAQARYYEPGMGRFSAEDPIKSGLNWYGYCDSNQDSIGIAIMGSFESVNTTSNVPLAPRPTEAQIESLEWLIGVLRHSYPNINRIEAHHEQCPGDWFNSNDFWNDRWGEMQWY